MTQFNISIVSDVVCPWCFVGKKRLEKGIEAFKQRHPGSEDTFSITWLPYYLNPEAPKTGLDKTEYYKAKFGEQRSQMMFQRLTQVGEAEGINFRFGGRTGNTRDAHRLIELGKEKSPETATKIVDELFHAYFEQNEDITSHAMLTKAATKAGLDQAEVTEWLGSDKGGPQVDIEVRHARDNEIYGVPHFTIQDRYEIEGGQEPAAFLQIFERVKASNL